MTQQADVLVLGGSGQVGYAVLRQAARRGLSAIGTSFQHPSPSLVPWDGSAEGAERLLDEVRPRLFVHAAGWTDVEGCESDERRAMAINAEIPAAVAKACRGSARYLFYSTEYVFDGVDGPYDERAQPHPISAYGRSKLAGEQAVFAERADAVVLRTTVVYGPDPNEKNFVAQVRRRLGAGERMWVPADQVSSPTYTLDLALASLDLLERRAFGVWNATGPDIMDRYQFAILAARAFGLDETLFDPVETKSLNQKAPRPLKAGMLTGKLRAELGEDAIRGPAAALQEMALGATAAVAT